MKMTGNTMLVTGGTSGIGLALAKKLVEMGNQVIVTGRDAAKLAALRRVEPRLEGVVSDAGAPEAIEALYDTVRERYPALNVLINNAGIMRKLNLHDAELDLNDLGREVGTNLLGAMRMSKRFLPLLKAQPYAAIVNVTSGLAFTPLPISPVYCAAKAGLHSFTQSLRVQLKNTRVKVFELAPPAVDTPLVNVFDAEDAKGTPLMKVDVLVKHAVRGLERDQALITPGLSRVLRLLSRVAPDLAVKLASGPVDRMLAAGS